MSRKRPEETEEDQSPQWSRRSPIIGIGASAGGVDALKKFFSAVDPKSGMGYVVVQHLDPEHESVLTQLLARITSLVVAQIKTGTPVEPDHIYVIPPNTALTIEEGKLHLSRPLEPRGMRVVMVAGCSDTMIGCLWAGSISVQPAT